jgi:CRP-like cAMP-binding protein
MTVTLLPEQERLLRQMIDSGFAKTPEEALARALDLLKERLPSATTNNDVTRAEAVKRLAEFRTKHGLTLGGLTIKELVNAGRP